MEVESGMLTSMLHLRLPSPPQFQPYLLPRVPAPVAQGRAIDDDVSVIAPTLRVQVLHLGVDRHERVAVLEDGREAVAEAVPPNHELFARVRLVPSLRIARQQNRRAHAVQHQPRAALSAAPSDVRQTTVSSPIAEATATSTRMPPKTAHADSNTPLTTFWHNTRMNEPLKPTLWRTARALSNPDRLNLMRLVANANGMKGVVDLAAEAELPVPTASTYLRALNARGLISVVRSASFVYYGTKSDRSLPVAIAIQEAFRRLFVRKTLPKDWIARLLPLTKAYANPRREEIVRTVFRHQPIRYHELHRRVGFCETSFLRHMNILLKSGVLVHDADSSTYALAKPANSLAAAFHSALS